MKIVVTKFIESKNKQLTERQYPFSTSNVCKRKPLHVLVRKHVLNHRINVENNYFIPYIFYISFYDDRAHPVNYDIAASLGIGLSSINVLNYVFKYDHTFFTEMSNSFEGQELTQELIQNYIYFHNL